MEELTRMVAIGTITTKNKEGTFSIEEFVDDVQPIKVLDQVWVTITKVPRARRSFLPLWAVGNMIGATQKVDIHHLRRTREVRILVAVLDIKIPKFADICVKGCMYRLYFKPDEEVAKGADQDDEEDLLTDDDKGNDADGDRNMRDANPARNPQGGHKEASFANPQSSAPQSGKSHRQATLIQEAIDMACEQLLEEISIKVMLGKDPTMLWCHLLLTLTLLSPMCLSRLV
jgi:hypothetical protein